MLSDNEIERAASQLATYRRSDVLTDILDKYSLLIEDYKRLKSDYEEERDAREKYKQMAKSQERNPFALVLVDGDGYVFHESLIGRGASGGNSAAQSLNDAIENNLRNKGLYHCQIMVRIYANVLGLSKALAKASLTGNEARSLAPFIAGFNRSYGLSEFVDAGELKENADFKIRALLRLYADNPQCKHIYFAACHDIGYMPELMPHTGNSGRFTLIRTPGIKFHPEFTKLGMGIESLSGVFRQSPVDTAALYRASAAGPATTKAAAETAQISSPVTQAASTTLPTTSKEGQRPICQFYKAGKCRYGKACKNLHLDDRTDASIGPTPNPGPRVKASPPDLLSLSFATQLPKKGDVPEGHVAVNKDGFRLDPYIPPVSPETITRLMSRIGKRRLCNSFHLTGFCEAGDRCGFDHDPLDDDMKPALESLARSMPCTRRGACRNGSCTNGHICQILECKRRGGEAYCKLPYLSHTEDLAVDRYVPSVIKPLSFNGNSAASSTYGDDGRITITSPMIDEEEEDGMGHWGYNGASVRGQW